MNNDFFDKLDENYLEANNRQQLIKQKVVSNTYYRNNNGISTTYKVIGYITILIGIILAISGSNIIYFFTGLLASMISFAIAEVIQLLQDIKDRISNRNY